ncbi:unnamed protein product, partial [Nippostrongylus brasiliensis]|uniref:RNA-dependent RNA polymerase n=1 Tax=Nippostrongylus brasiliensis TaxID=27835 RepID=A0A0N4XRM8_NIPBR
MMARRQLSSPDSSALGPIGVDSNQQPDILFSWSHVVKYLAHMVPKWLKRYTKFGKEYTFSDGVGMISQSFAVGIADDLNLGTCVPSCFQFRFRGMKGVLAVNPYLDELSEWASKNRIKPPEGQFGSWALKAVFRPSQK